MEKSQYFSQKKDFINSNVLKKNIHPFLKTGARGFYPLFYPQWIETYKAHSLSKEPNQLKGKSSKQFYNQTLARINKHKNIERKKTILSSLNEKELMIFMDEFFKMVESEVLEEKPQIQ